MPTSKPWATIEAEIQAALGVKGITGLKLLDYLYSALVEQTDAEQAMRGKAAGVAAVLNIIMGATQTGPGLRIDTGADWVGNALEVWEKSNVSGLWTLANWINGAAANYTKKWDVVAGGNITPPRGGNFMRLTTADVEGPAEVTQLASGGAGLSWFYDLFAADGTLAAQINEHGEHVVRKPGQGVVVASPDGSLWRVNRVDDSGNALPNVRLTGGTPADIATLLTALAMTEDDIVYWNDPRHHLSTIDNPVRVVAEAPDRGWFDARALYGARSSVRMIPSGVGSILVTTVDLGGGKLTTRLTTTGENTPAEGNYIGNEWSLRNFKAGAQAGAIRTWVTVMDHRATGDPSPTSTGKFTYEDSLQRISLNANQLDFTGPNPQAITVAGDDTGAMRALFFGTESANTGRFARAWGRTRQSVAGGMENGTLGFVRLGRSDHWGRNQITKLGPQIGFEAELSDAQIALVAEWCEDEHGVVPYSS